MKLCVEFNWWIEPEDDIAPEDSFQFDDDIALVREQMRDGIESAWCRAMVTAQFIFLPEDLEHEDMVFMGSTSIGGMSWATEKQLWKDNLQDMKAEALEELFGNIRREIGKPTSTLTQDGRNRLAVELDWLLEHEGQILQGK